MAVPALATTNGAEPSDIRTAEEILNEYHIEAFTAQMEAETGKISARSNQNRSTGKTLEEETVDELRAAGYEAYHVTSSNYDALEDILKTNFEEIGLDLDGSYIITICGEPSSNTRGMDPPTEDYYDDDGSTSFTYTYNGSTYTMRYLVVTSANNSKLAKFDNVNLIEEIDSKREVEEALNSIFSYLVDIMTDPYQLGTFASFAGIQYINVDTSSNSKTATLNAGAQWTRVYTQIYNAGGGYWKSWSSVDSVSFQYSVDGFYLDKNTNTIKEMHSGTKYGSKMSEHYNDSSWKKFSAVVALHSNYPTHDYAGSVRFYLGDENVLTLSNPNELFM